VPAPRKYDKENRARAVRMYQERIRDLGESKLRSAGRWARCWTLNRPAFSGGSGFAGRSSFGGQPVLGFTAWAPVSWS